MSLQSAVTTADLASLLGLRESLILDYAFGIDDVAKYSELQFPKWNGQVRIVKSPSLQLKMIQRRLLALLEPLYLPSSRAHAYIEGRGLRSNATPHIGKRYILNTDLVDFFGSINFGRIRGRLLAAPYRLSDAVATTIARLATCDGCLPLGAPTSPILSNMLCSGLDSALTSLAKNHGCFYSRYADDLTFSSNRRSFPRALAELDLDGEKAVTIPGIELLAAIESQGFEINLAKTRLLSRSDRQEVCGVVCNEKLNVLPQLRRQIRATLHAWRKFGLEEAEREWREKYNFRASGSFEHSLKGKIEFLKHIRGKADPIVAKYAGQFNELQTIAGTIEVDQFSDWRQKLDQTSCCIHSTMAQGPDFVQGSGFVIDGGYIVTNHHVIAKGGKRFDSIEVTFPGWIKLPIGVSVVAELPQVDLALLRPTEELWQQTLSKEYCEISAQDAARDDVVWLTGWPNFNDRDELHIVQGSVTSNSYPDGVRMFRITPNIVFGNSGGAVFDEFGKVVGIATRGSDIAEAPLNVHNGCVPAHWINDLLAAV